MSDLSRHGMRPGARKIFGSRTLLAVTLLACAFRLPHAFADPLTVSVRMADGKPLDGAVVIAHALSATRHRVAPIQAVIDQINLTFVPDILVVPVGSQITFPNSDTVSHQVYSFSPAKRFQLPLYRGSAYPPVRFETPGIVTLGCNIHDSMQAYIVVTDAPFFGQTDSNGIWSASDVPRGTYRVEVWHPRLREPGELKTDFVVREGTPADLKIRLTRSLRPAPLSGHPHSWDQY